MIISLIDRVIMLSHPEFLKNNFDSIIKILLDNGYPRSDLLNYQTAIILQIQPSKTKKTQSN